MLNFHKTPPDVAFTKAHTARTYSSQFTSCRIREATRIARCALTHVWSPIVWYNGRRLEEAFFGAEWCVLDFDTPEMSLSEAMKKYCDMSHFIGTTKSHLKEKNGVVCDRFRVALRFEEPIYDLRLYRWNMWRLLENIPCDPSCKDGARFFYPCTDIVQIEDEPESYRVSVNKTIPEHFDMPITHAAYREAGTIPPWTERMLRTEIAVGERNNVIYRIAKDLAKCGFSEAEIVETVAKSKTYQGKEMRWDLKREIHAAVKSGVRKAAKEIAYAKKIKEGGF